MYYQSEKDYVFDSSKFESAFLTKPTPYSKGIKFTTDYFKNRDN